MSARSYTLVRTLPDGQVKTQTGITSRKAAGRACFYVIHDNALARRGEAADVAFSVEHAPVNSVVTTEFGYTFEVREDAS